MKKTALLIIHTVLTISAFAQGTLSGDLMLNANFFQRDSAINAANNELYDDLLSGGEAWMSLRYYNKGFTATLRADAFHNSNLYNPTQALTGFGIGAWSLSKNYEGLDITVGYIYDQIGSGVMFRAYEDRGLLIDNALVGVRLKYQLTKNIYIKGFTGQQKNVFERYPPVIKAFNAEGEFNIGDKVFLLPGVGVLDRTLDQGNMQTIVSGINALPDTQRFVPRYNMYAFTFYNTLTAGDFTWFAEGSYKTHEAIIKDAQLQDLDGSVIFTTLGYARKGIAINLTGKRTENYEMRTSPNESLIRGLLNWQPIIARLRPNRLMARYTPASQNLSEIGGAADVLLSPNDNTSITLNYTHINTLENIELYREAYADIEYRGLDKWIFYAGFQFMHYNQEIYQTKPQVPIIESMIPFFEITYRINDKYSLRTQWEYQHTEQDYGSWIFGLVEMNIAPRWSFALSDMYNISPGPSALTGSHHYYNIFTAYTKGPHRFSLAYVKQVEGINCTGGVCRYEPAFSGVRFSMTTSF